MADAEKVAVWTRVHDWPRIAATLGDLFRADHERVAEEFARGAAMAYDVAGEGYAGALLLRFHDGADGLECYVIAFRGHNVKRGLADLVRVAQQAGAVALTLQAETAEHVRLYVAAGFEVERCDMRLRLNNNE